MRFGLVHRLMTNALATLGLLALVSSGQFSLAVNVGITLGLVAALLVKESWQLQPWFRHVDTVTLLGVIALQVVRYASGVGVLDVLVEFAAALQIVRLATRRGAAHDQQVIVLALLHLIAGTVLGGGLAYGLCFFGVLLVAPGALVLSHLRREVEGNYRQGARDRTGLPVDVPRILRSRRVVGRNFLISMCLLSIPIFIFTAVLFVFFPRVGLSLLLLNRTPAVRSVGFSPRVDLGHVGFLQEDRTIAMRVKIDDLGANPPEHVVLHLRGTALDQYDGRAWSQTGSARRPDAAGGQYVPLETRNPVPPPTGRRLQIDLEPIDPPVLFFPPQTAGIRLKTPDIILPSQTSYVVRGPEGEFRYQSNEERGISYEVVLFPDERVAFTRLDRSERDRYLQLPDSLSKRTRDLAMEWTSGLETPEAKAQAISLKLQSNFRYDRNSPSGRASDPLDHFLFESQRGHCEYYSTALAVMLRVTGVPTRNVTGFVGGQYNRFGQFYVVRQKDAHSWVEVYLDGKGWTTFDPTPAANVRPDTGLARPWAVMLDFLEASSQRWDRHIVGYDLEQQYGLVSSLRSKEREAERSGGRTTMLLVGVGLILASAFFLRRKRRLPKEDGPAPVREERTKSMVRATALYEGLEAALALHGVVRSPGTPPLRHAENLAGADHPMAEEVLAITRVYLSVRFGGMTLSSDVAQDLERRISVVRSTKAQPLAKAA